MYNAKLALINEIKPLPSFVKGCGFNEIDMDTVPLEKFASIEDRSYPCYNPASVYLSFAERCIDNMTKEGYSGSSRTIDHKGNKIERDQFDDQIMSDIVKSAAFFDILPECKSFASALQKYANDKMSEENKTNYALFEKRAYPIFNGDQCRKAQDHFDQFAHKYPVSERVKIAQFIEKKASVHGVPIRSNKVKLYSKGVDDVSSTERTGRDICSIALTVNNLPPIMDQFVKNAYMSIGKNLKGNVSSVDTLYRVVETLEELNKLAGLRSGVDIEDPFNTVFNLSGKMAQELVDSVIINEERYPMSELLNVPIEIYEEALGTDFVDDISSIEGAVDRNRLRDKLEGLTVEEQMILSEFLNEYIMNK